MEDKLLTIRNYASSLQGEERKSFINKFNSIKEDDNKIGILADRISSITSPKKTMFSSVEEAMAANRAAQRNQRIAEFQASGINPYLSALDKTAEVVAPVAFGGGVSTQLLKGVAPTIGRQALAGASGGAVSGALSPSENINERVAKTVGGGALGGAVGGAIPILGNSVKSISQAIRKLPVRVSDEKQFEFANKLRSAFLNTKTKAVDKFGNSLEILVKKDPLKRVNLLESDNVKSILTDPDLSIEASNVFRKTPILKDIISGKKNPEVTVKEAQDIINYLQFKVPSNIKSQHLDITDLINEFKIAQASKFNEMTKLRSDYAKVAEPFKSVKSQFALNKILENIDKGFGGGTVRKQIKDLFSDNPELLKEIGGYRNAGKIINGIKWAGGIGLGAVGAKSAYDAINR